GRGGTGDAGIRPGDVRSRGGGDPRQGRSRRDPDRECLALRTRGVGVDCRHRAWRARRARDRSRKRVRQRARQVRSATAVRRGEALRVWARALAVRPAGVRERQDSVGSVNVRVGTSGYNFPEWKGPFYPAKTPESKMLEYYAQRLGTVEINYTFYRMPNAEAVTGWDAATPPGFTFVL